MMQIFNIISSLSLTPYKMLRLSPGLTFYIVIPIIIVFIIVRIGMHFVTKSMRARMLVLQNMSSFIVSSLSGIEIIKGFDLQSWSLENFENLNKTLLKLSIQISFIRSFMMPVLHNLENILKIIILSIGGYYVINEGFTIGELTAFIAYSALLSMPIMGLGWLTTIIEMGMIGIASIETILSRKTKDSTKLLLPDPLPVGLFDKGLEVKNLSYYLSWSGEPCFKKYYIFNSTESDRWCSRKNRFR